MTRRWCLGAFFVCLATSVLLARQGTVKTGDGRSFKGDINENGPDASSVVITIHGVNIDIPRTSVVSIDYAGGAEELQNQLAKLPAGDVKDRLTLAQTAMDEGQFDVATQALDEIQKIDPTSEEAQTLRNTVAAQKDLQGRENRPARTAPESPAATPPTTAPAPAGQFLSMDDINTLRAAELQRKDTVRVQFFKDVRNRYLAQSGADAAEFRKLSDSDQALEIIAANDPVMSREVKINSDPIAFRTFRTRIQPRLLAGCAASGCHGGEGSGGFYLFPNTDQTLPAYTNFYILQMTTRKIEGGDTYGQGPVSRSMIDRLHPENSLILQYGLPANLATLPHPKVVGWKAIYRNEQDPRYVESLQWIGSLRAIVPDYGIKFEIPKGKPHVAPAAAPAAEKTAEPPAIPTVDTAIPPALPSAQPTTLPGAP